jgi:hypothetical protein
MNRWVVLLLGCTLVATASQAQTREIWEWTDANGVRHFSDSPAPGAKRITVTAPTPTVQPAPPASSAAAATRSPAAAPASYSRLEIWQPEDGATFFSPDDVIGVRIRTEPDLMSGDRLVTYLDGKVIEGSENAIELRLTSLERGAHSLTSVIYDARGNERIRSQPVVVNMRLPSVSGPNPNTQGPAVRPPQRPTTLPAPARPPRGG